MDLQCTRDKNEDCFDDLLKGIRKDITRIDELHTDSDNDSSYVFIIWANPDKGDKVLDGLKRNVSRDADVKQLDLGLYAVSEAI